MNVHVRKLKKTFPGATAPVLSQVSFDVGSGRIAAILGKSGAGKSTLLRCLVGLEPFDEGTVLIDGVPLDGAHDRRHHRVGMVFQNFELFPHLTVLQNCVLAPLKVRRESMEKARARVLELLSRLGLADKADAFPDHLSGGQKQRVAIVRALAMEPGVLLYDEPTSALDASFKAEMKAALRQVGATGITQVVVTHDVQFASEVSECVFVLDEGKIVEEGESAKVFAAPAHESTRALLSSWRGPVSLASAP